MTYLISASTPKTSIAVVRDDPAEALVKLAEFEDLGLTEVTVTTDAGTPLTRESLARLAAERRAVAA